MCTVSVYSSTRIKNCHARSDDFPQKTGAVVGGGRTIVCVLLPLMSDGLMWIDEDSLFVIVDELLRSYCACVAGKEN